MIWYKQGCTGDMQVPLVKCRGRIANMLKDKWGLDMFITSKRDGNHMMGSLHPDGYAFDMQKPRVPIGVDIPFKDVKEAAGVGFDVIKESDHFHIEYDPK